MVGANSFIFPAEVRTPNISSAKKPSWGHHEPLQKTTPIKPQAVTTPPQSQLKALSILQGQTPSADCHPRLILLIARTSPAGAGRPDSPGRAQIEGGSTRQGVNESEL